MTYTLQKNTELLHFAKDIKFTSFKLSLFSFVCKKQKSKMEIEWEDCIFNKLSMLLNSHFQSENKVSNNVFQKKVPSFRKSHHLHILKKKNQKNMIGNMKYKYFGRRKYA